MNPIKIFLLITAFFFSVGTGIAQTDQPTKREQRKLERAERKRLKAEERERKQELVESLVKDRTFVLEANTIFGRYMTPYQVPPNVNFVMVAGNQLTLQTANNFSFGYNGLGGITINGTINDYQVKTSEKNNQVSVLIQFTSPVLGHSTITMDIQADGISQARFIDNWGRRLTFQGQVEALEESTVFEGRPII